MSILPSWVQVNGFKILFLQKNLAWISWSIQLRDKWYLLFFSCKAHNILSRNINLCYFNSHNFFLVWRKKKAVCLSHIQKLICSYFQFVVNWLGYTEILIQPTPIRNYCFVKYSHSCSAQNFLFKCLFWKERHS